MEGFNYYKFQIEMVRDKLNTEIDFFTSSEFHNEIVVQERIAYLQNRLGSDKPDRKIMSSVDRSGNMREIKKMDLDEYAHDMNILVFDMPWNKLKEVHRIMKIDEYVNNLNYPKKKISEETVAENKLFIKTEIVQGLKDKRFAKNKSVIDYDQKKMQIDSISSVTYNAKHGIYEIDWDE